MALPRSWLLAVAAIWALTGCAALSSEQLPQQAQLNDDSAKIAMLQTQLAMQQAAAFTQSMQQAALPH